MEPRQMEYTELPNDNVMFYLLEGLNSLSTL